MSNPENSPTPTASADSYHNVSRAASEPPSGCPVVHAFSPLDKGYMNDPYTLTNRLRDTTPVFWAEEFGYLVVTRMEDINEVFLNPDVYSSANVQDPVQPICPAAQTVLAVDDFNPVAVMSNRQPPDHGRIRKYTRQGFSNRRMNLLEPYIRERAHALVDQMLASGDGSGEGIDFVAAFGHPLPGEVIFRFIGFPEEYDAQLKEWCSDRLAFSWGRPTPEEQEAIANKMLSYWRFVREFTAERRDHPADDYASEMIQAHLANPDDISYREVESVLYGLSFAGHEIVSNLLSNSLISLNPPSSDWDELVAEPSLIPNAVEEVIRWNSPQIGWRRIAKVDTKLGDVDIPAGTRIFLALGAANHQESEFPQPEVFDIHRENARFNISFGKGIHLCLGASLARLEGRVALEVLTERIPTLRVVPNQELTYFPNVSFRGPTRLLVEW